MLRAYREVFRLPGAPLLVLGGFLARVPMGMRGLGCLILVEASTGSYAVAGTVAAAMTLSQAACAPVLGRAADRRGQQPVILLSLAGHVAGVAGLVVLCLLRQPVWALVAAGLVSGATALPLGPLVRARWAVLAGGATGRLRSAYALESMLDEVVYITGPVLAAALAHGLFPGAGLLGTLVLLAAGSLVLVARRGAVPAASPPLPSGGSSHGVLRVRALPVLLGLYVCLGTFLGAVDVAVLAFVEEHGVRGAAGPLLALLAVGSMVAGLAWGAVSGWRLSLPARLLLCAAGLAVSSVPLPLAGSVPWMAVCLVLAGAAVAPTLVTGSWLAETALPRGVLTEGLSWMSSAVSVGLAAGAAAGGRLSDAGGSGQALLLAVAAGVTALVVAALGYGRLGAGRAAGGGRAGAPPRARDPGWVLPA